MQLARFAFPTDIIFGPKARQQVPTRLRTEGKQRPLIVTDKGLAALPLVAELEAALTGAGLACATFSGIWGNPSKSQVLAGVAAFREHQADCVVGLGGGAALDVAKAIVLMAEHPGDLFDYEDDMPGARPIDQAIPFWLALPTTAGTGSEVGRSAVISDDQTHLKKIVFSPRLLARAVYADPELTFALPAAITVATGMDALAHNVESYLAKAYHPICDGIALEGLRLVAEHLPQAVAEPQNLEARSGMMMASMMGAIAFQKGLGVVHSCAHALGTVAGMHHGLANGVMIDHALPHNLPGSSQKFVRMAQVVGLSTQDPNAFVQWLTTLKANLGVPSTLAEAGIERELVPKLVEVATADGCHANNPTVCGAADFRRLFDGAL